MEEEPGQVRSFDVRDQENQWQKYSIELEHGPSLLMRGDLQKFWVHLIAKISPVDEGKTESDF